MANEICPVGLSNVICLIDTIFLPLTDETYAPVHGSVSSTLCNLSKQSLVITDLEAPVSQCVDIFLQFVVV